MVGLDFAARVPWFAVGFVFSGVGLGWACHLGCECIGVCGVWVAPLGCGYCVFDSGFLGLWLSGGVGII